MSEEEATKILKRQLVNTIEASECGLATKGEFKEEIEAMGLVLNMLKKKEKEIERLIKQSKRLDREAQQYFEIIMEQTKIIYEMAEAFKQDDTRDVEEIIKYFTDKVENEISENEIQEEN